MDSPQRVVIAGGSGFLGRSLSESLRQAGFDVVILTRHPSSAAQGPHATPGVQPVRWTADGTVGAWASTIDGALAVVNLAGESLASGRWTPTRKARLRDSRLDATRSLVAAIRACRTPPLLVSGSAVGYYGLRNDEVLAEDAPAGNDFLATLCVEWEGIARAAADVTRVVLLRTGVVLDRNEGALPQMALPFRFFLGGRIGSGQQYLSWIHLEDWVGLVRRVIEDGQLAGPLNATAPAPVTNAEFSRTLGDALHRPALVAVPAVAARILVGEMADALVAGGQRVVPRRALDFGYRFKFAELGAALRAIYT